MTTVTARGLVKELRASGTRNAMRLANRLEKRFAGVDRKNNDILRGATFNLETQLVEAIRYCVSLDPLTEVFPTLKDNLLRIGHTNVPVATEESTSKAIKLLLETRPMLEAYAEYIENLAEVSEGDTMKWELAAVHAILTKIEKL